MSWTRGGLAALAACVLLLAGSTGCGSGGTQEHKGAGRSSPAPVGTLSDRTDEEGRHYREVPARGAPEVGIEVEPDTGGSWDVRLTVRNFRFSPEGTPARAVAGRGLAYLYVDGAPVDVLRAPDHRLPADLVPHGTHHVTARLYADDGTVWSVRGRPVESTADITVSGADGAAGRGADHGVGREADHGVGRGARGTGAKRPGAAARGAGGPGGAAAGAGTVGTIRITHVTARAVSGSARRARTQGHSSPDGAGKAS